MGQEFTKGLVSVVIPTYHHANFIDVTIESVVSQTYSDLEILVCDDGSRDGTAEKIRDWALRDERVKALLSERNKGFSDNINKGFVAATGEFLAILGGDDIMCPEKIERQVEFLNLNPDFDATLHWVTAFESDTGKKLYDIDKFILRDPSDWFFPFRTRWGFIKKKNTTFPPAAFLARSTYVEGTLYDTRLKYKNEVLYAIDNFARKPAAKWKTIPEVLSYYRIHGNNMHRSEAMNKALLEETYLNYSIAVSRHLQYCEPLRTGLLAFLYNNLYYSILNKAESTTLIKLKKQFIAEGGWSLYIIGLMKIRVINLLNRKRLKGVKYIFNKLVLR